MLCLSRRINRWNYLQELRQVIIPPSCKLFFLLFEQISSPKLATGFEPGSDWHCTVSSIQKKGSLLRLQIAPMSSLAHKCSLKDMTHTWARLVWTSIWALPQGKFERHGRTVQVCENFCDKKTWVKISQRNPGNYTALNFWIQLPKQVPVSAASSLVAGTKPVPLTLWGKMSASADLSWPRLMVRKIIWDSQLVRNIGKTHILTRPFCKI